jgi:uracil-DNA glycosylase family 4
MKLSYMSDLCPLDALAAAITGCRQCPRLTAWREEAGRVKRRAYREEEYWARPVPGFGDPDARLLIVGLAPGAHGSNRTGRVFTGDSSGDFLFGALHRAGFANRPNAIHRGDGLALKDAYITAALRCAPPANKPLLEELDACLPYLIQETALLPQVQVIVALGRIGYGAVLKAYAGQESFRGRRSLEALFAHAAVIPLGAGLPTVVASYHPSRQNTQTGRLTASMFDAVWVTARRLLSE